MFRNVQKEVKCMFGFSSVFCWEFATSLRGTAGDTGAHRFHLSSDQSSHEGHVSMNIKQEPSPLVCVDSQEN